MCDVLFLHHTSLILHHTKLTINEKRFMSNTFEHLKAWQSSINLAKKVYTLTKKIFMQKNKLTNKKRIAHRTSYIILGIDPGLADTGYGIIEKQGQKLKMIKCGSIKTLAGADFINRLKSIHQELSKIIKKYKPDAVAVEQLFFCKNVKTALLVGQARGVCLMTIAENNLPIYEYTPLQVKQALTSYGRADKNQIGQMVKLLLKLKAVPQPDDAADALAIAITCGNSIKNN